MEGVYKSLRGSWRRRGYQKLNGSGRMRVWRLKKLKLRRAISAPKKLLVWLRDAYVSMMLKVANSRSFTAGFGGGSLGAYGGFGSGPGPLKEYDEKMIVEIYKSLVMAHGLVPHEGASEVVCKR